MASNKNDTNELVLQDRNRLTELRKQTYGYQRGKVGVMDDIGEGD